MAGIWPGPELTKGEVKWAHWDGRMTGGCWGEMEPSIFRLWLAPKIFSAVADGGRGGFSLHFLHHVDNGKRRVCKIPRPHEGHAGTCNRSGTPFKDKKIMGPDTILGFLGIMHDTPEVVHEEGLHEGSLIGKLGHACKTGSCAE